MTSSKCTSDSSWRRCLSADRAPGEFEAPSAMERVFNRGFGLLVGLGLGLRHNYLLEVRGRTTGRIHATPVNVLELGGKRWLVAGRGRTQWVRNAEAAGEVVLRKGRRRQRVRVRPVADADKPAILSAYLDRYATTVQRYFPVRAGSAPAELAPHAARYPVFELES
jgi:deazaflavin-dependent oxidoreductase (nitroreductase family)